MNQSMQVLTSQETVEWYTPPEVVHLARQVLEVIDLDPASNPQAQHWIQAREFYTEADNGLEHPWFGRVWMNPPYGKEGRSRQEIWTQRLVEEYQIGRVTEAICLINSAPGYVWYERLYRAWHVCLATARVRFVREDGTQGDQAKKGQTFVYLGKRPERFREVFSPIGRVLDPDQVWTPAQQSRLDLWGGPTSLPGDPPCR